jgi:hypothetical protein
MAWRLWEDRMSVLEQLLFAVFGVSILAASLVLSDPRWGFASAPQRDNVYTLQSCQ